MKLVFVVPHFAPDVAPTGAIVTRIVEELGARGHTIEVVTSLPWYRRHRVEPGFDGMLVRREDTPWGRVMRLHPFPTGDKRDLLRRAASFGGFSALAAAAGARGGPVDAVLALSPPLTLGVAGWVVARARGAPLVLNVHDVFPDVAIELGLLTDARLVAAARRLERFCYARADAVTVLSDELAANVAAKIGCPESVHVIPNFVDTSSIRPSEPNNSYRREHGLEDRFVVMYAGNVGLSQSLDLLLDAAEALQHERHVRFVINGQGAARPELELRARSLKNVTFVDMQPPERLPELLAAADIHVVLLKRGLARASVPSKTYSILAAGRPMVASVDPGSEIALVLERSGAGVAVPPEDSAAFIDALRRLIEAPEQARAMGRAGRIFVETWASPQAVAEAYETLFEQLRDRRARGGPRPLVRSSRR